jgi:hypothetical protein
MEIVNKAELRTIYNRQEWTGKAEDARRLTMQERKQKRDEEKKYGKMSKVMGMRDVLRER